MTALLERDELLHSLEALRGEGGRLAFVGGEAGAGKTMLVRSFLAGLSVRAFHGSCENLTTPIALGPFVDIAAQAGGELAELVSTAADARRVARALLREATSSVVVLEDVHWADEATLDAIRVLGRRIEETNGLVIATYRDDEVKGDHPLRVVLGELASAPGVSRLAVPPLSLEAVCELALPHGADGEAIHRLTQGNAFFVTEVLEARSELLPETVRDAVLARVSSLGSEARRLLNVIALVPGRAELWLVEAVAKPDPAQLEACLAAGVVREEGGAIAFRHELARIAVERSVPSILGRTLHAALLEALAAPPTGAPDLARLAHHADQASDGLAVLQFAPAAGRLAAETGAHREAAAHYERALRYATQLPPPERAALLEAFAREAQLTGRFDESIDALGEATRLYREAGDHIAEGRGLAGLVVPYFRAGRTDEAEAASRRAIEVLESAPPSRELANAYATEAYARVIGDDNAEGLRWGEKAVATARPLGDREALASGLNMMGGSLLMMGEIETGIEHLEQSLAVSRESGIESTISSALSMMGTGLAELLEFERAEARLREHIAFAEERDLWPQYTRSWLALVHVYQGRWAEGTALAHEVLAKPHEPVSHICALIALGRVRARRGDPGADEVLDEALELAQPLGHVQRVGHVRAARAEAAWLSGRAERAAEEARASYALALDKRHFWFAGELAYWQHLTGTLETWPEWIAEPFRLELAGSAHAAATAWRSRGCPYEAARALSRSDEEVDLLEALSELDRLGAAPAARLVRHRLREVGATVPRGPRPSTKANPADLTRRELEVLRLVVAGLRNPAIAAELVLSPRTVEHHVSAILRKLRVGSREEAAGIGERLLADP